MAGGAAHLLVWRPGPRGGRAGGRAGRAAGGRGPGGGGGRSSLGGGRTEPDSGRRRRRRGACSSLPRDPEPRRQADRPPRPRPPHPPPALLANCRTLSLPLRTPFPWCSQRRRKKNFFFKLQNQRLLKRERGGGGGEKTQLCLCACVVRPAYDKLRRILKPHHGLGCRGAGYNPCSSPLPRAPHPPGIC